MRIFAAIVALCAAAFLFIVGKRRWWDNESQRHSDPVTTGVAILILMASTMVALAGTARANAEWGGPDLGISCDTVRAYRAEIDAMSPKTRAALAASFGITRKQRRQAMACLRKVN